MNTALTLKAYAVRTPAAKPAGVSPIVRTLVCKWDMIAVLSLIASSAVYGVYALTQMTGF